MATGRRRGRAIIYFAFILILLLVLVVVYFYKQMQPAPQPVVSAGQATTVASAPVPQDVVDIVVTTQDLLRGQEISDNLLALVSIPRKDYTEGVFYTDKKELVGARAKYDLRAHTPLTTALIFAAGATGSLPSFEIPTGKVAISIPISKLSSVAYGLQKGDHVNLIASLLMIDMDTNFQAKTPNRTGIVTAPGPVTENQTYVTAKLDGPPAYDVAAPSAASYLGRIEIDPTMNQPVYLLPSEPQRPRLVSQTLLQDIVILQLGSFSQSADQSAISASAPQAGEPTPTRAPSTRTQAAEAPLPDIVTLIVSPQDAVTLNYLMLAGANLNMVMRSAGDSAVKNTEAVTLQFILDQYQIPNPAKLPYGLAPRMDAFPESVAPFPEPGSAATPTAAK